MDQRRQHMGLTRPTYNVELYISSIYHHRSHQFHGWPSRAPWIAAQSRVQKRPVAEPGLIFATLCRHAPTLNPGYELCSKPHGGLVGICVRHECRLLSEHPTNLAGVEQGRHHSILLQEILPAYEALMSPATCRFLGLQKPRPRRFGGTFLGYLDERLQFKVAEEQAQHTSLSSKPARIRRGRSRRYELTLTPIFGPQQRGRIETIGLQGSLTA